MLPLPVTASIRPNARLSFVFPDGMAIATMSAVDLSQVPSESEIFIWLLPSLVGEILTGTPAANKRNWGVIRMAAAVARHLVRQFERRSYRGSLGRALAPRMH